MVRGFVLLMALGAVAVSRPPVSPAASYVPGPAARPLPFDYELYTFRGTAGRTTVVAAFAVQASELERRTREGPPRYRIDVSLIVPDTARRVVYRSDDSVYVDAPSGLPGRHLFHTFAELQVPPSRTTLHRVVMNDANHAGVGQLYTDEFPVPDYRGSKLMISDIAFGLRGTAGGWERDGHTLAVLPGDRFPESAFDLYYELYNLEPDGTHTTEVTIEAIREGDRDTGSGRAPVQTRFTERSDPGPAGMVGVMRSIESALPEGHYRLTVTVQDLAVGESVSGSREFRVREGLSGSSMVLARPRRPGG